MNPMPNRGQLSVHELRKSLGGRTVVDGVSLELPAGEVVGLLGPNGAGKTTIFGAIMGLLQPDQGRVTLEQGDGEQALERLPTHQRALLGIGYLPQQPSTFLGLTVAANLDAVLQLRRKSRARTAEILEMFGLYHLAKQRAGTLSGGERRRLELARTVALEPAFLLLDEPFKGLDPAAVETVQQVLKQQAAERQVGILISDHNVHQALTICHRAYILVDGRVVVSGTPRQVTEDPEARRAYWGWASPPGLEEHANGT